MSSAESFENTIKRINFEHEREFRTIIQHVPHEARPENLQNSLALEELPTSPDTSEGGIFYNVDLNTLIQKVIVAPSAPNWLKEMVISVAKDYGLKAPIKISNLAVLPEQLSL